MAYTILTEFGDNKEFRSLSGAVRKALDIIENEDFVSIMFPVQGRTGGQQVLLRLVSPEHIDVQHQSHEALDSTSEYELEDDRFDLERYNKNLSAPGLTKVASVVKRLAPSKYRITTTFYEDQYA